MSKKNLWDSFALENHPEQDSCSLKFHFEPGVDPVLRKKYLLFAGWLRKNYFFPETLNVYILSAERVRLRSGKLAYGSFKWFDRRPPRIKIPSAVEEAALREYTLPDVHEMIMSSLVHELTHYFQRSAYSQQSNAVSERQANFYRYRILEKFYADVGVDWFLVG